jgi:hypothetical protein
VNARAGRELFGEPAAVTIDVTFKRDGAAHVALVDLPQEGAGGPRATRELRSDAGCAEVAAAAALVVSLALDPSSILRAPDAPPPPPPPPPPRARRFALGLGPRASWGLAPSLSSGLALEGQARGERASLGLELAGFLAPDAKYVTGKVSVLPLSLAAVPCRVLGGWEACGVATFVALRGAGAGYAQNYSAWKLLGGLGARGAWGHDLGPARLRVFLEGDVFLPRTTFFVSNGAAWATRGVSFLAGVDALFFFE